MFVNISKVYELEKPKIELLLLLLILLVFFTYSIFTAIRLDTGIIPDEPAHFIFSKHYSTTWGRPPDSLETYSQGWYIKHNPFLYYWINGRIINLTKLIEPNVTDSALLVVLRMFSGLYSTLTLVFLYLLSKLIIHKAWWPLLPVFLLSNTLMFVFLSGGVNYDNLANLFCIGGIYFLIRVFNRKDYLFNSFLWIIFTSFGCLVKYTITPLAFFTCIAWSVYTFKQRNSIFPVKAWSWKISLLAFICMILILLNASIYGYNLIVFRSLTPRCIDLLNESQCSLSPYAQRFESIGLEKKLTLIEAIEKGFPHPLAYLFDFWFKDMLNQIYGILGHKFYYPSHLIPFYQLFFIGILCLVFQSWRGIDYTSGGLIFLIVSYLLVVFITNFHSELVYGFRHIAVQGRYLFPIIGPVYALIGYTLSRVTSRQIRYGSVAAAITLFSIGGPIKFIRLYETIFYTWFIHEF